MRSSHPIAQTSTCCGYYALSDGETTASQQHRRYLNDLLHRFPMGAVRVPLLWPLPL
jgi:hypothetical protein